ncbi:unnamed protein product [Allacma fusca]|uniref:Cytochrome P450 n=1 Tax=Allacma fusca TaxID=39272 RepID=A0A8J2L605_9HEXA|nr:unnamed protein product [Allacma fusca]
MFWVAAFSLLITLAFLAFLHYRKAQRYWPDRGISLYKSPSNILVLMIKQQFDFIKNELSLYESFKGKKYGGYMEFNNPVLYVTDLDIIKQIYIKDFDHFVNRRGINLEKDDPHMHYSLFNQEGDAWKALRIKMTPTFTTGKIRRMFTIFNSSAEKLTKALENQISSNQVLEIRPFIQKLTMDVIASATFGIESNLFEDPDSTFAKHAMKFQDFFQDALNHRQKTGQKRDDFLQILLEARSGQLKQEDDAELDSAETNARLKEDGSNKSKVMLTDDVIIAQCLLFFLAGSDTTESTVTFALYELAINPDIQEKLYQEVKEAVENNNGEFSYDVINKLEYLDCVIQESLRKYPPVDRTDRKCSRPYKLPDSDVVLPVGSLVTLPIYAVHHDPKYWPNPEKFDPERFTKENSISRHSCAFTPFGHGPRNCIGNRFALTEGKAAIAHIILKFELEPCDKTMIPIVFAFQAPLKPKDGTPLRLKPRF